jgi:hypothetical protein
MHALHARLFLLLLLKFQYQTSPDHESYISHFQSKLFSTEKKHSGVNKKKGKG